MKHSTEAADLKAVAALRMLDQTTVTLVLLLLLDLAVDAFKANGSEWPNC